VDQLDRTDRVTRLNDGTVDQQYGPPSNDAYAHRGLGTQLAPSEGENPDSPRAERLENTNKWFEQRGKEKSLRYGLSRVRKIAGRLELPDFARESAGRLFRKASQEGLLPGHNIDAVAAAAVFIAAYEHGIPRLHREIASEAHCGEGAIRREHQHLLNGLSSESRLLSQFGPTPAALIERFSAPLSSEAPDNTEFSPEVDIKQYAQRLETLGGGAEEFRNRAPRTKAAAALYLAGNRLDWSLGQKTVAETVGVSVDAIREAYQPLAEATEGVDP
jgi:transcription initiation factor TFIIB